MELVFLGIGVFGVLFGLNSYWHLWRWAKDCNGTKIAIARKRKVALQPTVREVILWARQLDDKEPGRVFYKDANTTVAVLRRGRRRTWRQRRRIRKNLGPQRQARHGTWSMRQDNES